MIYGSIIGLAVVVVIEDHPPKAAVAATTMVATAIAVGLAELYSELVGDQVRTRRRVERQDFVAALDDVLAVSFGVAFPAVFFLLAVAGVLELDTAIDVAKWSGIGLIAVYGFGGARLAGRGIASSLLEGLAIGIAGAVLVVVKALVH